MVRYIFPAFLLCLAFPAVSASPLIGKVVERLHLRIEDCYEPLLAEKPLPHSPGESVVVIPTAKEKNGVIDIFSRILVVDNATGEIKSKYTESWRSDTVIELWDILIDTAPYLLKENTRAFGIRLNYLEMAGGYPHYRETLTLFIREKEKLVPILQQLEVFDMVSEIGEDCGGKSVDLTGILVISKEKTNGYFNIQLKQKHTVRNLAPLPNGECDEKNTSKTTSRVLKLSEGRYK